MNFCCHQPKKTFWWIPFCAWLFKMSLSMHKNLRSCSCEFFVCFVNSSAFWLSTQESLTTQFCCLDMKEWLFWKHCSKMLFLSIKFPKRAWEDLNSYPHDFCPESILIAVQTIHAAPGSRWHTFQYENCASAMRDLPAGAGSQPIFPMCPEECGSTHTHPCEDACSMNPG